MAKKLVLWSILGLWTLLLFEGLAAVYFLTGWSRVYYRPIYLEQFSNQWLWRTEYHPWGGWHKPSQTAKHVANCFSVEYRSNAYGARDRERSFTARAPRAVILGDSFIEGYGVEESTRLSNLLEEQLGFEVLNFGMTHFGPLQYQIIYDDLVRQFDHDLVIVGLLPNNDFWDNDADFNRKLPDFEKRYRPYYAEDGGVYYPRAQPTPSEPTYFEVMHAKLEPQPSQRSFARKIVRMFWLYGLYVEIRYNASVLVNPETFYPYPGYMENDARRISRVTGSLLAIQKAAAPRPVLVVFLPDYKSWDYIDKHPGSYQKSVVVGMRDTLESHGIKTIDLLKPFMDRGLKKEALYLPCDGHWNATGHHAALEVLAPVVGTMMRQAASVPVRAARSN
jgi:hypothetical protein